MLMSADLYEGEGAHIYRSIPSIRVDIDEVTRQIEEINDSLNIRNIVMELISDSLLDEPKEWIPELAMLIRESEAGLRRLTELKDTLGVLKEELEYTKCALSI